ncbi:MAG: hypothetical protein JSR76_03805 [Verrucomicrobia bacterium]|nr:hypothetical protein [Verrucomicrobiota bacterium]
MFTRLIGIISLSIFFLPLYSAQRKLSLSFYEKGQINFTPPYTPKFMQGEEAAIDKGYMLFYEQQVGGAPFASFHAGATVGLWNQQQKELYTSCLFLSSKFWPISLPLLHPYIEVSTLGPALLFQGSLSPRLLFQNFIGIGLEIGGSFGLAFDLRMVRYYTDKLSAAPEGLQVPLLLSMGILF